PAVGDNQRLWVAGLVGLTLLACGVPADDPQVAAIIGRVRSEAPNLRTTYDLAVSIWLLDQLDQPSDRDLIRTMALRLVAGQGPAGGWDYNCDLLSREQEQQLLAALEQPVQPPDKEQPPRGAGLFPVLNYQPGQPVNKGGRVGDNSNTQFAVLGLWVAQKHGVPVQRSLTFAEARYRSSQLPTGGWSYSWGQDNWQDSMVCSGLVGLAAGKGAQPGEAGKDKVVGDLAKDPQIEKALKFLGRR